MRDFDSLGSSSQGGSVTAPSAASPSTRSFVEQVARLQAELSRHGVPFVDMRRAQSLELQFAGAPDSARPSADGAAPIAIERLEGAIVPRQVPVVSSRSSRLRYFLDGSQRTVAVCRVGVVPVVATVAAAAVLVRDAAGRPSVAPGTLRLEHTFLLPRRCPSPELRAFVDRADELGMDVVDPLDHLTSESDYAAVAGNYGRLIEHAYDRARRVRRDLEARLLQAWVDNAARATDDGWTVVDGRLHVAAPRTLGLVKQFSDQHLGGAEAAALFGLPPGHRTTAYRPLRDWHGKRPADRSGDVAHADARTLWYLRFWDARGLDARHALVRIEAPADVRTTDEIDELSAWLMAERTPRATADARWATLLYPVHYLEQILKRRVDAHTRGWPAPR